VLIRRVVPALAIVLGFALASSARGAENASHPDSSGATPTTVLQNPPVPHLFTPGDLIYLGATLSATALAMSNDQWLTNEAVRIENDPTQRKLAQTFQPLGQTSVIFAATAGMYVGARMFGNPRLARRVARGGIAVATASLVTYGLKQVAGRERPEDSPNHSDQFKSFSGSTSFPSGHAATAFAAAVALDRETSGRWVPYVVYPAATLVSRSRVHDFKHWTSDVVAGAAIGGWTAWKVENFLQNRALGVPPQPGEKGTDGSAKPARSLLLLPEPHGGSVVLTYSF
jgi:membrane-associated phospholipid phosphatase